jgi:ubiquinone/menaquinone biosynthesis C-methylase UbiE
MNKKTKWKKFYDKTSSQRGSMKEFKPVKIVGKNGTVKLIITVKKHLKNGMKIIDMGCGTGHILIRIHRISDKKVKMIGIDNSSGMIKIAKQKSKGMKNISFFLMDAFKTKFKKNTFDIVINRFGAPPESYNEACRILKKKGLFLLLVSNDGDWGDVRKHFGFQQYSGTKEQLDSLKEAGFKIVKIHKFSTKEFYNNKESLAKMLEIIPFKPNFNKKKHAKKLMQYAKKNKTKWGIKASLKRILIISKKT